MTGDTGAVRPGEASATSASGARPAPNRSARSRPTGNGGRARLLQRFRYLRNWEAANVVVLPLLLVWLWEDFDGWVRLPPLILAAAILAQGAWFWHLKIRQVQDGVPLPAWFARRFRAIHRLDGIALALYAAFLLAAYTAGAVGAWDFAWGVGLLLFALAEFINYFHVQLMHDSDADWRWLLRHRRLRRAPLASDVRRFAARSIRHPQLRE